MNKLSKIGLGCGGILAFGLILIVGLTILVFSKQSKFNEIVNPFFDEVMPVLAQWDHRSFNKYWAPEIAEMLSEEDLIKLFGMFQRLGVLNDYTDPQFRELGSTTEIPYSSYVTYQFEGHFENGEALLSWILVRDKNNDMKVWRLDINSDVFIVPIEVQDSDEP